MSDTRTGHIELAVYASALAEAVRAGQTVPAGRLLGLPETREAQRQRPDQAAPR